MVYGHGKGAVMRQLLIHLTIHFCLFSMGFFMRVTTSVWTDTLVTERQASLASPMIEAAHKYHGILTSTCDEYGYRYFIRDGRKCRLLNKKFLKYYN